MLINEKMFLANCDPVRKLSYEEVRKRLLLGVTLSKGVIITPSALLDNPDIRKILSTSRMERWFKEDGAGTLSIRSPGTNITTSVVDYFDSLPNNHYLSRFGVNKSQLGKYERDSLRYDLQHLDAALRVIKPTFEGVALTPSSLSQAILSSDEFAGWKKQQNLECHENIEMLIQEQSTLNSRSAWYATANKHLSPLNLFDPFRLEVIDANYNSLFVAEGEAFVMDRIPVLHQIPAALLDTGIAIKNLRKEHELLSYAIKGVDFVTALGAGELVKFLADEAISYVEEHLQKTSFKWATRANWFGAYPVLTNMMGVKLK